MDDDILLKNAIQTLYPALAAHTVTVQVSRCSDGRALRLALAKDKLRVSMALEAGDLQRLQTGKRCLEIDVAVDHFVASLKA